jgi:hypothetical protein
LSQLKGASLPILFGWPTSNDRLVEEYKDPATSPYLGMTLEGHLIPESPEGLAEAFAGPELLPWHVSLVLLQWQSYAHLQQMSCFKVCFPRNLIWGTLQIQPL